MSQHDYNIANQGFPSFRTDLNNAFGSIQTMNSGASAPTTTAAFLKWADTTNGLVKMRNSGDSAWISLSKTDGSQVFASSSSVSTPAFSKSDDTNTGLYFPADDQVGIACGGKLVASFNTTDGLLVEANNGPYGIENNALITIKNNTNSQQLQFHSDSNGHYITVDNYPDRALFISNNCSGTGTGGVAGKINFQNRDTDGILYTNFQIARGGGIYAPRLSTGTTSYAMYYDATTKEILRDSSSKRYKKNIVDLEMDSTLIYEMSFKDYEFSTGGYKDFGPIAEDLDKIGFDKFVAYDEKGRPDAIKHSKFYVPIIIEMKKLKQENDALKKRVSILEKI